MRKALLALASALTLSACAAVGPNYVSPAPQAPAQQPFASAAVGSAQNPAFSTEAPPDGWWRLYRDPALDRLVEQALAANTDLRVAAANLAQARAVLRETRAGRTPSTTVGAGASYGQPSAASLGLDSVDAGATFDVGLDVGYQADLFGRIRRAIEASQADVEAVQAARDVVQVSVAAETARAYAQACGFGLQLTAARRSLRIQEQTFDLTRRQLQGGRGTGLTVAQAGAQLDQVRSQLPQLEAQRRTALFRLAVLTGRPPAEISPEADRCVTPPTLTSTIPVGDGAGLLRRRPDVRRAERQLAAATARIGVATAELYPDVSLGLSVGSTATDVGDLFSSSGFRWSLGPLISWTFPNTRAARSRIAQAEAGAAAALAQFDGTWLGALEETEGALTRYALELDRLAALRSARNQSAEAARLARLRFDAGRESFLSVLDAERVLAQSEAALAQSEAQLADLQVSIFLALGGGWETPSAAGDPANARPAPRA